MATTSAITGARPDPDPDPDPPLGAPVRACGVVTRSVTLPAAPVARALVVCARGLDRAAVALMVATGGGRGAPPLIWAIRAGAAPPLARRVIVVATAGSWGAWGAWVVKLIARDGTGATT